MFWSDSPQFDPSQRKAALHRRLFLNRSLKAAALAAPVGLLAASEAKSAGTKAPAAIPGLVYADESQVAVAFKQIQADENAHVEFLVTALGSAARPEPTFQNLEASTVQAFVQLSLVLENTGVGAYLGAAPAIFNPEYLSDAGSILAIEARHSGFLGFLTGSGIDLFANSFQQPGNLTIVMNNAGPYIASLNGGPPLSFSSTPSAANDISILNVALALEYLEQQYYNINVPKFFG